MFSIFAFFVATLMIILVHSQQWTGSFKVDSTCSRTICCCFDGTVIITNPTVNTLTMICGLSSQCGEFTTFSTTTPNFNDYSGYLPQGNTNFTLTLSSDSNTISAVDPTISVCNGNAYRSAAIKQFENIITIMVLAFIGLSKIVS